MIIPRFNIRRALLVKSRRPSFWIELAIGAAASIAAYHRWGETPPFYIVLRLSAFLVLVTFVVTIPDDLIHEFASRHKLHYASQYDVKSRKIRRKLIQRFVQNFQSITLFHKTQARGIAGLLIGFVPRTIHDGRAVATKQPEHEEPDTSGMPVYLFQYKFRYRVPGAPAKSSYSMNVIYLEVDRPHYPEFIIDSGQVYDFKQFIPQATREAIRLEGTFGMRNVVYIPYDSEREKRLLALSALSPDVLDIFDKYFPACNVVVEQGVIMITTLQNYIGPNGDLMLEGLRQLVPKIERQLTIRERVDKLADAPTNPSV